MSARVLVLEDDETLARMLAFLLEHQGLKPELAGTIEEARGAAGRELPALMIIDVRLPDGNGLDLLEELRRAPATAALKAIVMSTENNKSLRARAEALGVLAYWHKPFDIYGLAAQVRAALAS